jgi:thiol:disulfide interchange protein DsbD
MRLIGTLLIGLGLTLEPVAALAQDQAPATQARLVSEVAQAAPGEPFWIGLALSMAPGWHTYWKNPGDAGVATKVQWQPFEGATVGPIQWPVPRRLEETGNGVTLVSFAYEGEVVLPMRVTPSASLAPDAPLTLTGRAEWVECREVCVRRTQPITLSVPLGEAALTDPEGNAALIAARQAEPQAPTGWRIEAQARGKTLILTTAAPTGTDHVPQAVVVYPEESGTLDLAAPQRVTRTPEGHRIELALSSYGSGAPKRFKALLVAEDGWFPAGGSPAIAIDVPVNS